MPKFRKKPVVIEADRWYKNGDHPLDGVEKFSDGEFKGELLEGKVVRYFRSPDMSGGNLRTICKHCGFNMHKHGWIDAKNFGHIVCPGDWIITREPGYYFPLHDDVFQAEYEPVA